MGEKVTPTRIELVLPPWKGDVLTAWPRSQKAPRVGLEPTTPRLTAACSTIELSRKVTNSIPDLPEELAAVLYHWAIEEGYFIIYGFFETFKTKYSIFNQVEW